MFIASLVPLALAAFLVAPAPAANAASCGYTTAGSILVARPFLSTAYGAVGHGTQASGNTARPGLYSTAGGFNPTAGYVPIVSDSYAVNYSVHSSDGVNAVFCGYRSVSTAYGVAVYGVQYSGSQGRWGNYNLSSSTFYPDNGDWHPLA
jgi:hypothetical protein